ncbi:ATP-binding protein [Puniceicoccus vermicola]|uniref:histidine kinase n=1 Tax=Puniceicoccus vermicola TaxID=388746 RepID=A0A7X1AYX0_9BACT|nr:ATP-binding protein [Puniceicoccus vermicola]MBC2602319.1 response regulator [Puniceicoccus vermicola]
MRLPNRVVLRLLLAFFSVLSLAAILLVIQTRSIVRTEILNRAIAYHQEIVNVESAHLSARTQQAALQALRLSHRGELRDYLKDLKSPDKVDRAQRRMQSFLERNPEFSSAAIIGLDFRIRMIMSQGSEAPYREEVSSDLFEKGLDPLNAMAKIPVFVESSTALGSSQESVLRLTAPIFDENDLTIGILALDLDLDDILRTLNPDTKEAHFFVIDEEADILLEHLPETEGRKSRTAVEILSSAELRELSRSRQGNMITSRNGGYLVSHSRLDPHLATGVDATLVQVIPLDSIFRPIHLLLGAISVTVIAILGFAMCIVAVLAYRIIRPIGRLSHEMIAYNPGEIPTLRKRDVTRKDEIGRLFSSFEFMAQELNESFNQIQEQMTALQEKNEELKKKTREAEELARAKSDFLAVMSHEIRTPINAIVGFSQLLEEDADPDERDHCTKRIMENSERLLFLVENILDFTRIQGGRVKIAEEEFNPALELEALSDNFRTRIDSNKVSITLEMGLELDQLVIGDSDRIRQILSNLMENALKFTLVGEIRIRGELFPLGGGDHRLEVQVADTGLGIPPENLKSIFLPFEQVDHGLRRKFEGSGLGLAICKRLAELMGGSLEVESTVGKGSTFTLSLPLRESSEPSVLPAELQNRFSIQNKIPSLPIDFLIVEDDSNNAEVLQKFLKKAGAKSVNIAHDRREAEEKLRMKSYGMILMDLHLGEESGLDIIRSVRADTFSSQNRNDVPIVAITAYALDEIRDSCLTEKVNAFITKPFSTTELSETLVTLAKSSPST